MNVAMESAATHNNDEFKARSIFDAALEINNPDNDFTARDIFGRALAIESPEKRAEFVKLSCKGNADLQRRVENLLNSFHQAGDFMEDGAAPMDM